MQRCVLIVLKSLLGITFTMRYIMPRQIRQMGRFENNALTSLPGQTVKSLFLDSKSMFYLSKWFQDQHFFFFSKVEITVYWLQKF